ncbi:competence/damage-inducible protein A [Flavobacteriaceae bacterium]|jgi:nicotinamide-nucleotide amidase|nr:competence/damage-inducible protein A [Flavobacteriaceae bacterium]MBT5091796.1 competence/damage-inducible protein A [Flavobacteriaceae bacterium]MBT5283326.1 competence/damage-inducible protein A [Flavobacteriaceae bacterium]MBT5446672.1 competence/damage-inducible protein A [Flavobacteriaceae bacterium]MBT5694755.1 competence/damage-inducible protein A [Flavobacteriaceae bacterium]|tara:strand:- start:29279 stop:30520 length:1242 start_codon:yes stop_codon:yes gene_type:complete
MKAELITIGDEILIGQIVNTNAVFLSKALNKIGIEIAQITSISDDKEAIIKTLDDTVLRAQVVILTGGLGPTKDDLTKHTLCEYFNDTLIENKEILAHIEEIFAKYITTPINNENRKQALLPSKARVLKNEHGTASGMWFEKGDQVIISLPGVPFEMKSLMTNKVIPALQDHYTRPFILHKTVLTYGLGESVIAERLIDWENNLPKDIKLAYLPNLGRVRLRLSSKGNDEALLLKRVNDQIDTLLPFIEDIFVGFEDETSLEIRVQERFIAQGKTLAIAESCTGGLIASRLTKNPGSSAFFNGAAITYHTQSKIDVLGVSEALIKTHSVVSEAVAASMAQQVRKKFNATIGVATTGNAGPLKGDSDAEIGTVCIAIASEKETVTEKFLFGIHRERVVEKAVNKALEMIYKQLE